MLLSRRTRKQLCTWMAGVLLCAQWMVSAYACPQWLQRAAGQAPEAVAPVHNCHGQAAPVQNAENTALCKAHCVADEQAPVVGAAGDLAQPTLGWCIVAPEVALPQPLVSAAAPGVFARAGAPPGWPPVYLTLQVLRN